MTAMPDIRSLRQARKMRQRDLAELAGIPVRSLMKLERGLEQPEVGVLKKLFKALDLTGHDLKSPLTPSIGAICGEGYVTSVPETVEFRPRAEGVDAAKRPVLDLFCGVGGFSFGFEMTKQFQVVAGIDLLGDRLETFVANHRSANAYGQDIRSFTIDAAEKDNPRPFIVVGGPPCQGFSSLRPFRNVEWKDPRNNLGEEFIRIVGALQPEWVVFENVVGLLTHQKGTAWKAVVEALEAIGYRTSVRVLNAAFHGLPQKRERLFIVGSRKRKAFRWPRPTHRLDYRSMAGKSDFLVQPEVGLFSADLPEAITVGNAIDDLPPVSSGGMVTSYNDRTKMTEYQRMIRNGAKSLAMHEATAHSLQMLEIIRHAGANINALPAGMVSSGFSSCYSRLDANEPSTTITVNFVHPASNRCIHPIQHRALTPREGARLQGFYDTFDFKGNRSQIVKQIGNAVPPLLGKAIAEAILESD